MNSKINKQDIEKIAAQFSKDIFYLKNHVKAIERRIKGADNNMAKLKGCYKHILLSAFVRKEYEATIKRMIKQIEEADLIAPEPMAQNH